MTHFILPGGAPAAAQLHFARTICRRAERCCVQLIHALQDLASNDPSESESLEMDYLVALRQLLVYLNRLGDWLFVVARYQNHVAGCAETKWIPGK